jgi:hypothetical protein
LATDLFGVEAHPTANVSGSASQSNALNIGSRCPVPAASVDLAAFEVLSLVMEFVDIVLFSSLMVILL